ncbi:MAG TPA: nuclear transport factor 2 family protein [Acidimicrobiales bacterium]|nr:nuclear transport factor 2 family protein [Acidimicrobiales bacterium]
MAKVGLTVEDQLAIQQLAARYNHAIDSGDGAAYADTFVDDGVLDAGELVLEGRTALRRFASAFPGSVRSPRHVATSLLIDGGGGEAVLRAYVQMYALVGDPPRPTVTASGTYTDSLVKLGGAWRFVRRTFTADA